MKVPVFSVVTPSLNQGEFIERTILSVIGQAGDFFIDYIVMDGGSNDRSVEIIEKYEHMIAKGQWQADCRGVVFQWKSEKDEGQSDALNKGFQIARGDIVSWINSDDTYIPGAFQAVARLFEKTPDADFVFGDGDVIDENDNVQWEWLSRPYNYRLLKSYHFMINDSTNYIMQQSVFWRRQVFEKIGALDPSFHFGMDYEYWIRAGSHGLKMVHIPVKLGRFRMIKGTKSLSDPTVFWPDRLEIFRRYNGAKCMKPFLTYFFFNKLIHSDFDLAKSLSCFDLLFESRWQDLPENERQILRRLCVSAWLCARKKALKKAAAAGKVTKCSKILADLKQDGGTLFSSPSYWMYLAYRLFGVEKSKRMEKFASSLKATLHRLIYTRRYLLKKYFKKE